MKTTLLLIGLAAFASVRAENPAMPSVAADAERAIERAYLRSNAAAIARAAEPLEAALIANPKDPALLYTRAFAHYTAVAPLRAKNDRDGMLARFEQAIALLERVRGEPWEAEAAALQANILGNVIGLKGGWAGMTLGPKSSRLLNRAEQALPGNPRVLLFRGISLLNTPKAFGGDPKRGLELFQQAVERFEELAAEAERAGTAAAGPGPRWGHADALVWLGLAKKNAGDLAGARAAWAEALAIEPEYAWVKFALWPTVAQNKAP